MPLIQAEHGSIFPIYLRVTFTTQKASSYDATSLMFDWIRAPLASLLVCDPQLFFTTRNVILQPVANITAIDVQLAAEPVYCTPSPGNVDPEAARTLFTSILTMAVGLPDTRTLLRDIYYINFNSITAEMLLQVPPTRNWDTASAVRPPDIETINDHLDVFTLLALKALTSGYKVKSDIIYSEGGVYETSVNGTYTERGLARVPSLPFYMLRYSEYWGSY